MRITANSRPVAIILIIMIMLVFLAIQLPTLSNPPWEKYDSWRQSDTYSIAVNYYQYEYSIFKPQFNYDGPDDNYVQLEFQVMTFLSATIFKLMEIPTPVIPRAINLLFFLGSALYTYLIMRKFSNVIPSVCGFALYLFMPITLLYSRAIMPESPALFFFCGGVYYLLKWYMDDSSLSIWISSILVAIAITQKTPVLFVGILILCVFIWKLKKNCLHSMTFYGYAMIALAIPAIYYFYTAHTATFKFVNGIAIKHIFTKKILSFFTKEGLSFFFTDLPIYFGWALVISAGVGFLLSFKKERRFILVWTLAFGLEWMTIVAIIKFGYYLIFMAPIFCVLTAIAISDLFKWRKQIAICGVSLLFCLTAFLGIRQSNSLVRINDKVTTTAALIQKHTTKDDIIAITASNPVFFNAANRRGYRANLKYYDYIPQEPENEVRYFIDHGVTYFIVLEGSLNNSEYLEYLETNYSVIDSDGYCTLFRLE